MKLLAIETSSDACSVALQSGSEVTEQHVVEPRRHTQRLLPMIETILDESGLRSADLDAVVLGNGPGSFIGMRLGASVAQGLCYGAGIGIVPVSSLAVLAAEAIERYDCRFVMVAQDARMQEVYVGRYSAGAAGLPQLLGEEEILPIGGVLADGQTGMAAGAAFGKFPELWSQNAAWLTRADDLDVPRARYLLPLGAAQLRAGGAIAPERLEPSYIRVKVAEKPG